MLAALVVGCTECWLGLRRRHEDYRALAEALRIQYVWLACRLDKMVSEFYLSKQTGELVWGRDTMSEVLLESAPYRGRPRSAAGDQVGIETARTWIDRQRKYYGSKCD